MCSDAILKCWCNSVAGAFWLSICLTEFSTAAQSQTEPNQTKPSKAQQCIHITHRHAHKNFDGMALVNAENGANAPVKPPEKRSNRARLRKIRRHTHALNYNNNSNDEKDRKKRSFTACYIAVGSLRFSSMYSTVLRVDLWLSQHKVTLFFHALVTWPSFVWLHFWPMQERSRVCMCVALLSISSKWRLLNRSPRIKIAFIFSFSSLPSQFSAISSICNP